jgi:hypothetical protein
LGYQSDVKPRYEQGIDNIDLAGTIDIGVYCDEI